MSQATSPKARIFTGWHLLLITVSGFSVIVAVNLVMVFLATHTFPGMVVENSYVASQAYNELIHAGRLQAGWSVEWTSEQGILRLKLAAPRDKASTGLSVTALAGRPSTDALDRRLSFREAGDGAYRAEAALPPGIWEIDLEARRSGELVFRQTEELNIPAAGR